ncbi:MAG: NAD(P)-dependent oxidoreductase, partial [Cyanobacteria bacterium P01_H01_bin.58]
GAMGVRMAQTLLKANYPVVVYNRTPDKATPLTEQGAVYAATPKAAAEQADVVISMVTDNAASETVWLTPNTGALYGLRPDTIAIASSTLTVAWTRSLASAIAQQGAKFLDAPVAGSRPQAEAGKLIYLVGGEASTLAAVADILQILGSATYHLGSVGQGMAMKLAVNALFGIQVAAMAEILGLLTHLGLSSEATMACLGELPVTSAAAKGAGTLMAKGMYTPMFPIELVAKDFGYVTQTATAVDASTPMTTAALEVYKQAIAQGLGEDNITGVAQIFT